MDNEVITYSNLLPPRIMKCHETDSKILHLPEINLSRLLWIEGSLDPYKAKGRRETNRHWPVDKIVPKRKNRPPNMCSADFSVNRETMGKKPVAFLVDV